MTVLPKPQSVRPGTGAFTLTPDLAIDADPAQAAVVRRLLSPGTGLDLPVAAGGALRLIYDETLPAEAYVLDVTEASITITASHNSGVNWATQTLRQLLPPSVLRGAPTGEPLTVPAQTITDQPRFAWRGVLFDAGRHFIPLRDLFGFVDLLALHKHNALHLHLTEDQGWRFESKKYPRLNEISSWRTETKRHLDSEGDGTPHGGLYTQDQLRALVAYADQRGVTVVPELEFPGHVSGLLAAYPELGNHPETGYTTTTNFGVSSEVLNMTDAAMAVVFDLYEELLEVFPSTWIHVGGDECPREEWIGNPAAIALAAERGLPGPEHLQQWFTGQLRDWLAERGRVLVGWDEINDEGVLDGAVCMAWRSQQAGIDAAAGGQQVIMAATSHTYFDYYPSDSDDEHYAIGGLVTTERAYSYDPLDGVADDARDRVVGTQCQLWTEYVPDPRRMEYMLYPRASAHAEVAWSAPEGRSWEEFQPRLAEHLQRLDALGINYRPEAGPYPWQAGGTGHLRRPEAHRSPAS